MSHLKNPVNLRIGKVNSTCTLRAWKGHVWFLISLPTAVGTARSDPKGWGHREGTCCAWLTRQAAGGAELKQLGETHPCNSRTPATGASPLFQRVGASSTTAPAETRLRNTHFQKKRDCCKSRNGKAHLMFHCSVFVCKLSQLWQIP